MFADHASAPSSLAVRPEAAVEVGAQAESIGLHVARYAVALVLVWIGAMKFTGYEAGAIEPLVANSPLMAWLYAIFSVQTTSNLIGVAEIAAGALIALRPWSALAAAVGSLMAIATFAVTLTFLFSTPGWEPSLGGFPALSVAPGQFILKDAVLLGVAIWSFGEALKGVAAGRQRQ
jgi:reactive chlorine resistance protein C